MHRQNTTDSAIRTFKDHSIAVRTVCDPKFPACLWCRLIRHAEIALNLLRTTRIQPKILAFTLLYGLFTYNRTPISPPGTKILVRKKLKQQGTWQD